MSTATIEGVTVPEGAQRLLDRLRKGIEWLTETHRRLTEVQEVERRMEERFLEGLDKWDRLEALLRYTYSEHQGCILGPGQQCPKESPVSCRGCSDATEDGNRLRGQG